MYKKKVYVAEDDPSILEIISLILMDMGFDVETSPNGMSLSKKTIFPDLILLDIRMSGSNGGEICRTLKSDPKTSYIPVLLISANRDLTEIGLICKADAVLAKPFDIEDLISLVSKYT